MQKEKVPRRVPGSTVSYPGGASAPEQVEYGRNPRQGLRYEFMVSWAPAARLDPELYANELTYQISATDRLRFIWFSSLSLPWSHQQRNCAEA